VSTVDYYTFPYAQDYLFRFNSKDKKREFSRAVYVCSFISFDLSFPLALSLSDFRSISTWLSLLPLALTLCRSLSRVVPPSQRHSLALGWLRLALVKSNLTLWHWLGT